MIEEIVFRGALLAELAARFGAARAVAGSAALFALLHADAWAAPVLFTLGTALGALAWASGSVWAAVLLHAAWNAFAYFDPLGRLGARAVEGPAWTPFWAIVLASSAASLAVLVPRLRARSRAVYPGNRGGRDS